MEDVQILAAYSDGVEIHGVTTLGGFCELELYRSDDQMTLLMAGEGHAAYIKSPFVPKENNNHYVANMKPFDGSWGHSILFIGSTGYIPGIDGRLNPHKGLYVYGDNLSINGTVAKPAAHFKLDEWLEVRDSKGMECSMRFKVVEGNFSLLELHYASDVRRCERPGLSCISFWLSLR